MQGNLERVGQVHEQRAIKTNIKLIPRFNLLRLIRGRVVRIGWGWTRRFALHEEVDKLRLLPGHPAGERDVPRGPAHAGAVKHRALHTIISTGSTNSLNEGEEEKRTNRTKADSPRAGVAWQQLGNNPQDNSNAEHGRRRRVDHKQADNKVLEGCRGEHEEGRQTADNSVWESGDGADDSGGDGGDETQGESNGGEGERGEALKVRERTLGGLQLCTKVLHVALSNIANNATFPARDVMLIQIKDILYTKRKRNVDNVGRMIVGNSLSNRKRLHSQFRGSQCIHSALTVLKLAPRRSKGIVAEDTRQAQ